MMSNENNLYAMSDEELLQMAEPAQDSTEPVEQDASTQEPQEVPEAQEQAQEEPEQESETEQDTQVDYEQFYQHITKPFRANGRDVQIDNPDDVIRLMQQGANYSKKMEELKPKRALIKVLEEHGLDNKDKLGYLIDLANKDPKAIAKLINESQIDLYEFDTEQAKEYTPNLQISEPTAFEDTLSEVTSAYPEMNAVLPQMGQWDNESKDVLFNEPNILRALAEQKRSGLYDKITNVIEQERMLGRMNEMSYLQAYSLIESKLLQEQTQGFVDTRPTASDNNTDKKKKAGTPNSNPASNTNTINMLAISDEELLNLNL